jgi:hypothetical protein
MVIHQQVRGTGDQILKLSLPLLWNQIVLHGTVGYMAGSVP